MDIKSYLFVLSLALVSFSLEGSYSKSVKQEALSKDPHIPCVNSPSHDGSSDFADPSLVSLYLNPVSLEKSQYDPVKITGLMRRFLFRQEIVQDDYIERTLKAFSLGEQKMPKKCVLVRNTRYFYDQTFERDAVRNIFFLDGEQILLPSFTIGEENSCVLLLNITLELEKNSNLSSKRIQDLIRFCDQASFSDFCFFMTERLGKKGMVQMACSETPQAFFINSKKGTLLTKVIQKVSSFDSLEEILYYQMVSMTMNFETGVTSFQVEKAPVIRMFNLFHPEYFQAIKERAHLVSSYRERREKNGGRRL